MSIALSSSGNGQHNYIARVGKQKGLLKVDLQKPF